MSRIVKRMQGSDKENFYTLKGQTINAVVVNVTNHTLRAEGVHMVVPTTITKDIDISIPPIDQDFGNYSDYKIKAVTINPSFMTIQKRQTLDYDTVAELAAPMLVVTIEPIKTNET
jgi:hypothetical protein